jgi:molybdate transport system substrate-binding protein
LVAAGVAELGFQQLSELLNLPGIAIVGSLPPAIQHITIFSGGISVGCGDPAGARALLSFLASPLVAGVKQRHGMEPA